MMFRIFIVLICCLQVWSVNASQCRAIFSGEITFAVNGLPFVDESNRCNGSTCSPISTFEKPLTLPEVNPTGAFTLTAIAGGQTYEHTIWDLPEGSVVRYTDAGTAILLFSGNLNIPANTVVNKNGDAADVLMIVYGALTIGDNAEVNAYIYSVGGATLGQSVKFTGAISTEGGLRADVNGEYYLDPSNVEHIDSRGFCETTPVNIPISCTSDLPELAFSDDFSTLNNDWQSYNLDRNVNHWTKGNIFNSRGENQLLTWEVADDQLTIAGATSTKGDNEFGLLAFEPELTLTDTATINDYAVFVDINANKTHENNDVGLIFGYQNTQNYYLVRWTKFGIAYRDNSSFPGHYRRLELIKVVNGTVEVLAYQGDFDANDPFNLGVVVNELGTAVCVNKEELLYAENEQPLLNQNGIHSYDNDNGVVIDNFETRYETVELPPVLALYSFEQSSFDSGINDTGGNNYHGTNNGGTVTSFGKYCSAFDPNGSNTTTTTANAFKTGVDIDQDIGTQGTISFWFKSDINWNEENERVLFDATDESATGASDKYFTFEIMASGGLKFSFEDSSDADFKLEETNVPVRESGVWYFLTVVWDYDNNDFVIYVDGQLIEFNTTPNNIITNGLISGLGNLVIGDNAAVGYASNNNLALPSPISSRGKFDEVRVYSQVLNQTEVRLLMLENDCEIIAPSDYCAVTFVDAVTTHSAGDYMKFENEVKINNNPDNLLATSSITGSTASCAPHGSCTEDANGASQPLYLGEFLTTNSSIDYSVGHWENGTKIDTCIIGEINPNSDPFTKCVGNDQTGNQFDKVTVEYQSTLYFSASHDIYKISELKVESESTIYLPPGDYWIDKLTLAYRANVIVNGDGIVRLFTNDKKSKIENEVKINENGKANDFIIYAFDDLSIQYRAEIDALVYSQGQLQLDNEVIITGAASANILEANYRSEINYSCNNNDIVINHFLIEHDGRGLTCEAEAINIKACFNTDCSVLVEDSNARVTVTLNGQSVANSTLDIDDTGESIFNFNYTSVGDVIFALDQGYECDDGNSTSCLMTFADAELKFFSNDVPGISNQLSGKNSNQGFGATNLELKALQRNTNSGACEAVVVDNQYFEVAAQCNLPAQCSENITINNAEIAASENINYQSMDMGFDDAGVADFWLNYPDAGKLTLYARYNIPVDGSPSGNYMTGESSFTVRPFGFDVAVAGNPRATNASGDKFIAAGEEFIVTLTAKQWQAVDDTNNDGVPDDGAVLSDNVTTTNFGGESAEISHSLLMPSVGVNPALSANEFSAFSSGTQSQNISWDEVGILRFDANLSDNDYLGAGDIQGNAPYVGRFTPHHYKQTVSVHGELAGECAMSMCDWVYTGQKDAANQVTGAIRYNTQPVLTVTAYAANGIDIVENFTIDDGDNATDDDFMRLDADDFVFDNGLNNDGILTDENQKGKNGTDLLTLMATWSVGELTEHSSDNGSVDYTFSDFDHYYYIKEANSEIGPFTAEIPLKLESIVDSDGITQGNLASDLVTAIPTGVEVRFGRATMKNSYGPELSALPIPMQLEYLNASGNYIVNSDDNYTDISTENDEMTVSNIDLGGTMPTVTQATETSEQGLLDFIFLQPQGSNRGKVKLEYQAFPWLLFDWNGNGNFDDNPTAIATFGLYRGNDRIIQWREINP
ncbi:MAG: DUF6701 domain-containing protein [Thalassotalea sp.]